jgi:hypothetical protein
MVHGDFAYELGLLQLGLQHLLLRPHTGTVASIGCLFDLLEKFAVAFEKGERF